MTLLELLRALDTYQKLVAYIEGGGLTELLMQSGDAHFEAARRELAVFDSARDKQACVSRAAVALQTSRVFYETSLPKSWAAACLNAVRLTRVRNKHNLATAALVACYIYLKEKTAALRVLSRDDEIGGPDPSTLEIIISVPLMLASPFTYINGYNEKHGGHSGLSMEQFSEFQKAATELANTL